MLVLGRNVGQKICIGENVEVIVVSKKPLRLGVEAPRDVRVVRGEVADREKKEGERADG